MRFLEALFGGTPLLYGALVAGALVALLLVLNLIGLLFGRRRHAAPHRLAVLEAARIDGKRQVVLIRRDGTEYMLLTGGPQDLILDKTVAGQPVAAAVSVAADPAGAEAQASAAPPEDMIAEAAAQLSRIDRRIAGRATPRAALTRPQAPVSQPSAPSAGLRRSWRLPHGRDV